MVTDGVGPAGKAAKQRAASEASEAEAAEGRRGGPPGAWTTCLLPFVQRGADRTGMGLGLAIVRQPVEVQGGHLSIHNHPPRGCVFGVRLPLAGKADQR